MDRVIVKDNWVKGLEDWASEFFWTWCVGAPLVGGILVTGGGMIHGYMTTPQDESVIPNMVRSVRDAHVGTWKIVGYTIMTTGEVINELRPSSTSAPEKPVEDPKPPVEEVIPPPINDIVPDVGECDPYGPMDFSYDPPRLVCEVING